MREVDTGLRLALSGGTRPAGDHRYRRRAAIVLAVAALFACAAPGARTGGRYEADLRAGLDLYEAQEYALAARRFGDAAEGAASRRDGERERRALAAACVAWLRADRREPFARCSERLEALYGRARRPEPGLGALLALGAIAGDRRLPEFRVDPAVYPVIRSAARGEGS